MADPRATVERALGGAEVRPITLDAFHTRRERKRRNQRLAAGAVGVSIALAGAFIAARVLDTFSDRTAGQPVRNGEIVFKGASGLSLADPSGSSARVVVRNVEEHPSACDFDREHPCSYGGWAWSPDGTRLAFVYGDLSAGLLGDMSLYVMDAATNDVRLVARCPAGPGDPTGDCDNGSRLSWSPDSEQIAIASGDSLFLVDAASGEMTQVTGCEACSYQGPAHEPAWSPNGERIAFSGNDLMLSVSVDGSAVRTLVRSSDAGISINGADPRWSPDGTQLTFSADEGVYVVNADGSGLTLLVSQGPGGRQAPRPGRRTAAGSSTSTRRVRGMGTELRSESWT